MPELPEVEIICRDIKPLMLGYKIVRAIVRNARLRYFVPHEIITLNMQDVLHIERKGKYLLLQLTDGWIILHLGMSGTLRSIRNVYLLPGIHDHIDLVMNNGYIIRYTDPRRFGFWLWDKDAYRNHRIVNLGIEPLLPQFDGNWLFMNSRNINRMIKIWIMDSKIITGIGNIYANESLFDAGILPYRLISSLSRLESKFLANSIKRVLLNAIKCGGTTLRNFFRLNGDLGLYAKSMQVYGRFNQPCFKCNNFVKYAKYANRGTFFCTNCQY